VLALQRAPAELQSVEDVAIPGPAGILPARVYRALEGSRRLHRELGDWMRARADG
jgi:hypothetical protein